MLCQQYAAMAGIERGHRAPYYISWHTDIIANCCQHLADGTSCPCGRCMQGTSLAKAREIGETVMRQAQDLAAGAGSGNAAASIDATIELLTTQPSKTKTVLLFSPDEAAASPAQQRKQLSTAYPWSTPSTAAKAVGHSSRRPPAGRLQAPEMTTDAKAGAWYEADAEDDESFPRQQPIRSR